MMDMEAHTGHPARSVLSKNFLIGAKNFAKQQKFFVKVA
jgi:hypothetical protein